MTYQIQDGCHCTDPHSSADEGLDCAVLVVLMQLRADTCIQLLHRTTKSKICVVISMSGLCGKDPDYFGHVKVLIELGCASLHRHTRPCDCASKNPLWNYTGAATCRSLGSLPYNLQVCALADMQHLLSLQGARVVPIYLY